MKEGHSHGSSRLIQILIFTQSVSALSGNRSPNHAAGESSHTGAAWKGAQYEAGHLGTLAKPFGSGGKALAECAMANTNQSTNTFWSNITHELRHTAAFELNRASLSGRRLVWEDTMNIQTLSLAAKRQSRM